MIFVFTDRKIFLTMQKLPSYSSYSLNTPALYRVQKSAFSPDNSQSRFPSK